MCWRCGICPGFTAILLIACWWSRLRVKACVCSPPIAGWRSTAKRCAGWDEGCGPGCASLERSKKPLPLAREGTGNMQQIALQEVVRQRRRRRRLQPRAAAAPKRGKGPGVAVEGGGDTGEKTKLSPNWGVTRSLREEKSAVYNCKKGEADGVGKANRGRCYKSTGDINSTKINIGKDRPAPNGNI